MNLFAYCNDEPVNAIDPSGNIAITTGLAALLVSLFAIAAVTTTVAYVESKTHAISNTVKGVKNKIEDISDYVKDRLAYYAASLIAKRYYNSHERHHIVAKSDPRAFLSRLFLKASGIDINDERNLVDVKRGYHRVLHTNAYYAILNLSMLYGFVTNGKKGVEEVLSVFKEILGGLQ